MSGCEAYQIVPLKKFEISFKQLVKSHYRKNQRAKDSFSELVDSYIKQLRENPSSNSFSQDEPFSKECYDEKFRFRKIRFKAPELSGEARYARLMYVVNESRRIVYLLWIYTHKEFSKRPPEDDLKNQFSIIQEM